MSGFRPGKRGGFHSHYDNERPQKFSRTEGEGSATGAGYKTYDNGRQSDYVDRLPDPSKCERCELSKEEVDAGLIALLAQVETDETNPGGNKDILRSARELRQLLSARADTKHAGRTAELNKARPSKGEYIVVPEYVEQRLEIAKNLPPIPSIEPSLQAQVFKHASLYEKTKRVKGVSTTDDLSYERFEFIGDAYLELMATRLIAHRLPALDVPAQAHFREQLIRNDTLSKFSRGYGLPDRLQHGHLKRDGKAWDKITADIFEAYVAAVVYTDPIDGFLTAEKWMTQLWTPQILEYREIVLVENVRAQDELNKLVHMNQIKLSYIDEKNMENTADGKQKFMQGVYLTGWGHEQTWLGSGYGQNKQQAAMNAAQDALTRNSAVLQMAAKKKQEFLAEQQVLRDQHRQGLRDRVEAGDKEALAELRRLIANDSRIKAKLAKKGDQEAAVRLEELRAEEAALDDKYGKEPGENGDAEVPVKQEKIGTNDDAMAQDSVAQKSETTSKKQKKKKEAKAEESKPAKEVKQSAEDFLSSIISGGKTDAKSSASGKDGSSYLEREQKRKEKEERKKQRK